MKKYLMTGIAVVAMCAAFTSCSKDKEMFDPDFGEKTAEARYEAAFVSRFGEIASNQDWGFGQFKYKANARTRAINVNGNMWEDCPTVADFEEQAVWKWVKTHNLNKVNPSGLTDYFVTQIHKGTDTYTNNDGGNVGTGSDKMNNLHIAMTSSATISDGVLSAGWEHINNFNAGNCTDWAGGDDGHGNTLVVSGGTFNFAYEGSEDSKYHDKWVSVDGASIDSRLAGYYYICFDFEQDVTAAKTVIKFRDEDNTPQQGYIDGAWDKTLGIDQVMGKSVTIDVYDWQTQTTTPKTWIVGQEGTSEWVLDNIENGNQIVEADGVYDDWIIRLVKAEPYVEEEFPAADVRVLAEDLDVEENFDGEKYKGDFDFNDAVFDVIYDYQDATWIIVQAAGGTYPLYVEGVEVHAALNGATNEMINTNGTKNPSKPIKLTNKYTDANDIPVTVQLPTGTRTLEAGVGRAPHKLAVRPTFEWMTERTSIESVYTNFSNWVKDPTYKWYE